MEEANRNLDAKNVIIIKIMTFMLLGYCLSRGRKRPVCKDAHFLNISSIKETNMRNLSSREIEIVSGSSLTLTALVVGLAVRFTANQLVRHYGSNFAIAAGSYAAAAEAREKAISEAQRRAAQQAKERA